MPASQWCPDFPSVDSNASVKVAAVAVPDPSLSVMLNSPGVPRELSAATIVNATGCPLSLPVAVGVTVCAAWSKVAGRDLRRLKVDA
jgi:hypothetical protein